MWLQVICWLQPLDCFPSRVVNEWSKETANGMVSESPSFWALAQVWLPLNWCRLLGSAGSTVWSCSHIQRGSRGICPLGSMDGGVKLFSMVRV